MTILVVFFGGFQSSQPDMDKWLDSARKQRSDVQFEAFPTRTSGRPVIKTPSTASRSSMK
jgi:hypothetical protein